MRPLYGKNKKRIWELDALRGLAVLLMLFDHLTFDLADISYYFSDWAKAGGFIRTLERWGTAFQNSALRAGGHYVFVVVFLLLVGISCTFSHSNVKRGLQVLGCGFAVTIVTRFLVIMGALDARIGPIVWGILQVIGFSILLYAAITAVTGNRYVLLGAGAAIILAGILIDWTNVSQAAALPKGLTRWQEICWFVRNDLAQVMWGLKWYGPDCFGILPCAGVVLVGGYVGKTFYRSRRSLLPRLDGAWNKPFRFVGRHAIAFYLAHQPIILAVVLLLGLMSGLTLAL